MIMTKSFASISLLCMLFVAGCSSNSKLPEYMIGVWYPENNYGIAIRFGQTGSKGEVFYADLMGSREEIEEWRGPLVLKATSDSSWSFTLEEINQTVGNTIKGWIPPTITHNIEYGIQDATNRSFVRSYDDWKGDMK